MADSLTITPVTGMPLQPACSRQERSRKDPRRRLRVKSYPGSLQVLNITSVENYLPGVVRAEAGKYGPAEYFRAQAVVARTYIYRNIDRHELDGYNLCDDTHCQVYPGIITESLSSMPAIQRQDRLSSTATACLSCQPFMQTAEG